jgi:hypothetical protein
MGKSAASVKALLQAVRRNPECFPSDFMFQLSDQELGILRSQTVTSKRADARGGRRTLPYAFVEIMRAFVRLRRASLLSAEIMKLVEDLSNRVDSHEQVIGDIVESIRQLAALPPRERSRPIGFTADLEADSS